MLFSRAVTKAFGQIPVHHVINGSISQRALTADILAGGMADSSQLSGSNVTIKALSTVGINQQVTNSSFLLHSRKFELYL